MIETRLIVIVYRCCAVLLVDTLTVSRWFASTKHSYSSSFSSSYSPYRCKCFLRAIFEFKFLSFTSRASYFLFFFLFLFFFSFERISRKNTPSFVEDPTPVNAHDFARDETMRKKLSRNVLRTRKNYVTKRSCVKTLENDASDDEKQAIQLGDRGEQILFSIIARYTYMYIYERVVGNSKCTQNARRNATVLLTFRLNRTNETNRSKGKNNPPLARLRVLKS